MTLLEVEAVLSPRGLRLRRAVRLGKTRRVHVEVAYEDGGPGFEATGTDLREAVDNAVAAAKKRPVKNRRRPS